MKAEVPGWVRDALSRARFAPYLCATGGGVEAAIAFYEANSVVAAAFVHPLHYLEVTLRNTLHRRLSEHFDSPTWWTYAQLNRVGEKMLRDTKSALRPRAHGTESPDDIVAKLNLGFWVALVSSQYHDRLWVPVLHKCFPGADRRAVHYDYEAVRRFRNRVMHHEPIHHRHLSADHATLCRLLGVLSPEAAALMSRGDRVPAILCERGLS